MVAGHVQLDLQRLLQQQFGGNGTAVVSGASSSHGRAFFFFIPGFGAQNHRQDDLVVSFLFVVATENAFCSGRDSGFLR
jgi:hypothetical protein